LFQRREVAKNISTHVQNEFQYVRVAITVPVQVPPAETTAICSSQKQFFSAELIEKPGKT
jgi:hypothetical protein